MVKFLSLLCTFTLTVCAIALSVKLVSDFGAPALILPAIVLILAIAYVVEAMHRRQLNRDHCLAQLGRIEAQSSALEQDLIELLTQVCDAYSLRSVQIAVNPDSIGQPIFARRRRNFALSDHLYRQRALALTNSTTNQGAANVDLLLALGRQLPNAVTAQLQEFTNQLSQLFESRRLLQQKQDRAAHDQLTGCLNAFAFYASLEERLALTGWTVVGLLDLDDFKQVNDIHGHDIGDQLLQLLGERLQGLTSETGAAARLHGDEFAFWLPTQGMTGRQLTAANRARHQELCTPTETLPLTISVSLGAALIPSGTSSRDALRYADQAMYAAKRQGKNCAQLVLAKSASITRSSSSSP